LKVCNGKGWVELGKSNDELHKVTRNLERSASIVLTDANNSTGIPMQITGHSSEHPTLSSGEGLVQTPDAAYIV
jgi:hypothetical protein